MSKRGGIDPLTLSLIETRLHYINQEVGERMLRQCFSYATAHLRDLGSSLINGKEQVVTVGNFMPGHTAGSHVVIKAMLDWIGRDNIGPDDFIIGNDPYIVACGHPPDWSMVRPVFYEGELVFYHYARTHQYDSGGAYQGAYFPRTYDCHGEGLMIPPVRIIEGGLVDEKAYSIILRNVRGSSKVRADNMLVYTSMKKAEERILDLFKSYGKDTVMAGCDELISRTEKAVRKIISGWPAGTYTAERAADWDGTTDEPVWVRLKLTVKPEEGQLIMDWTDSDAQVDYINCPIGRSWASTALAVAWALPPDIPRNQGLFNCITMITKEGSVLSPIYPATCAAQGPTVGTHVTECVQVALSQVVPERASALWSRHLSPILSGKHRDRIDPRTGSPQIYWMCPFHSDGSKGAVTGFDGGDGVGAATISAGAALRGPIEVEERENPYIWLNYEFITDSAGDGKWRGGLGNELEMMNTTDPATWKPLDCLVMTGNSDGEKFGALGFLGGTEGDKHRLGIIRGNKKVKLRTNDIQYLKPGDIIWTRSGGGGGIGDPLEREIEQVQWDVHNEYISIQKARETYGVVIDPETFEVNYEETERLRKRLKAAKKK
jgi:N-methylhydantoinase B